MLEHNISLTNCREENFRDSIFTSLIEVLRKELAIYQELKNAISGENAILIKPSLDELNHSNGMKENIILKARMLEEVRLNIIKKLARNFDINIKEINLSVLMEYADDRHKREIGVIREELEQITQEINALNEINKALLDASLRCVQSSLDFIGSMMFPGAVYSKSGQIKTIPNTGKYFYTEG
jgi:flagellar biosynthesis/type III secretory pathway chaperone